MLTWENKTGVLILSKGYDNSKEKKKILRTTLKYKLNLRFAYLKLKLLHQPQITQCRKKSSSLRPKWIRCPQIWRGWWNKYTCSKIKSSRLCLRASLPSKKMNPSPVLLTPKIAPIRLLKLTNSLLRIWNKRFQTLDLALPTTSI